MPESSTIMGLVGAFIAIAIMLNIGVQILGNVQTATNCTSLPGGFHTSGGVNIANSAANATGWGQQCFQQNTNAQSAYTLLGVILIVVAAVAILFVVRLL